MCYKQLSVGALHNADTRLLLTGEQAAECQAGDSGDLITQLGKCVLNIKHPLPKHIT